MKNSKLLILQTLCCVLIATMVSLCLYSCDSSKKSAKSKTVTTDTFPIEPGVQVPRPKN